MTKSIAVILVCLFPMPLFAAGVVAQRQQMKNAAQQAQVEAYKQAQMHAYQQAAAEHQAQEMQAYQQQVIMQQAVQERINQEIQAYVQAQQIQAAEAAMVKQIAQQQLMNQLMQDRAHQIQEQMIYQAVAQATQQAIAQRATQQVYAQQVNRIQLDATAQVQTAAVANVMQQRQQMEFSKGLLDVAATQKANALRNEVEMGAAVNQKQYETAVAKQLGTEVMAGVPKPYEQISSDQVKDVVDIAEVWKRLDQHAQAWTLLIDNQAKAMTVSEYIERYRKEGARISQSPMYYVSAIDAMVTQNPEMLERSFKELLQFVAIVDYDFDAGVDRDSLAKRLLGDGVAFQANKKRLGR